MSAQVFFVPMPDGVGKKQILKGLEKVRSQGKISGIIAPGDGGSQSSCGRRT